MDGITVQPENSVLNTIEASKRYRLFKFTNNPQVLMLPTSYINGIGLPRNVGYISTLYHLVYEKFVPSYTAYTAISFIGDNDVHELKGHIEAICVEVSGKMMEDGREIPILACSIIPKFGIHYQNGVTADKVHKYVSDTFNTAVWGYMPHKLSELNVISMGAI
jgi:hypothetical protein